MHARALLPLGALTLVGATAAHAQLVLAPGDLAVVMANSGENVEFSWVAFKDVAAGTVLYFTKASYGTDTGGGLVDRFRYSEHLEAGGPLVWLATSTLAAGTVVRFDSGTGKWVDGSGTVTGTLSGAPPNLKAAGDQVFAYTGSITDLGGVDDYRGDRSSATVVYGLNYSSGSGWLTSGLGSTALSYLPPDLAAANVSLGADDYWKYTGPKSGTPAELIAAVNNPANWTSSNTTPYTWTTAADGNFTVVPEPRTYAAATGALLAAFALARRFFGARDTAAL